MRLLLPRIVLLAVACSCFVVRSTAARERKLSARALVDSPRVLVIAHRGDSAVAPENTLPAFTSAVRAGSDLIELDYHHTADGVPVVLHDATLDRTTDACQCFAARNIEVATKPLAELVRLDAGSWFGKAFAGTKVPTLEESLVAIQAGSMTLVERKAGDAATCVRLLRAKGLLESVVVQAFDWQFIADCHREAPELVLAALGREPLDEKQLDEAAATGARIIAWRSNQLTDKGIEAIHRRGLRAWVWTVDNLNEVEHHVDGGVDGVITNVPLRVRNLLAERTGSRVRETSDR